MSITMIVLAQLLVFSVCKFLLLFFQNPNEQAQQRELIDA